MKANIPDIFLRINVGASMYAYISMNHHYLRSRILYGSCNTRISKSICYIKEMTCSSDFEFNVSTNCDLTDINDTNFEDKHRGLPFFIS